MIGWLERKKLIRKGLACDKTRRQMTESELIGSIELSGRIRLAILCFFAFLVHILSLWGPRGNVEEVNLLAGIVFLSGILLLHMDRPEIWRSNSRLTLALGTVWINLLAAKALFIWSMTRTSADLPWIIFFIPTAFTPLILTSLLGVRAGLFGVLIFSLLCSALMEQNFFFLLVSLVSGFTAVYFSRRIRRRNDLIRAGVAVGVSVLACALIFGFVSGQHVSLLIKQAGIGIGVGIATAMAVNAILPVLESVFGLTTDISWIESADLNHPLLRQMTIEAPGTYHHSLVVANLVEAAATAIGANPTKARVLAYFHDIGKMIKPEYFTENIPASINPHENLSPNMSALVIIAHVKEGVDLALKYRLKKEILCAIQQHHGDTVVYYFYKRAQQMADDARIGGKIMNMREEDIPDVSENSFRYPGPLPQSKEIGLLMLADSIEGASRSIDRPNPQKIEALVTEIIEKRIHDHQLDECELSLKEIRQARESFIFTLQNMMHSRISYPKDEKPSSHSPAQSSRKSHPIAPSSSAAA